MSDAFLGEIRMTGFNFAPRNWSQCNGQILPIDQNQALYSILGNAYGGDGRTDFGLPDLRGRVPVHRSQSDSSFSVGAKLGLETTTLSTNEIPAHNHGLEASNQAPDATNPSGNILAQSAPAGRFKYGAANNLVAMRSDSIQTAGSSQGYDTTQPFQVINFIISMAGTFPARN